ncbi:hypothetical protein M441DRAFT_385552 [Trichoderma asperellum CBS 433.97]|uniref:Uncharacterized protein n=1 Tax=Trichoderma asperellum (strain ATCC 204424 / CBS 433.97 / NBRC 101777) TaxID=1042311 RepID=A0A2T3ZBI1_TRIA4|nr:hypothetical protein M441DRAFT_385552 [Trichoderma asperellum CBS 433.97]PTB42173.1 hypothetical protein M441DRAFT_385552 [Trichoderma asperellum CBS 433.97]
MTTKLPKQRYANKLTTENPSQHLTREYTRQKSPDGRENKRGYYLLTITSCYILFSTAFLGHIKKYGFCFLSRVIHAFRRLAQPAKLNFRSESILDNKKKFEMSKAERLSLATVDSFLHAQIGMNISKRQTMRVIKL